MRSYGITANIVGGAVNNLGTITFSPNPTTGVIRGTVTDSGNNQPLSGVTVTISGPSSGSFTTGSDGNFIFTNVNPGTVTITVSKTGYLTVTGTVSVVACSIATINVRMTPTSPESTTGKLMGRVADCATYKPVTGAVVSLSGGPTGTTDAQGMFLVQDIQPGTYEATISKTGYRSQSYPVMIIENITVDMQTICISPTVEYTTISGRVTESGNGNPMEGATVSITGTSLSAYTDTTGAYTISGITQLEFNVKASSTGYDSRTTRFTTTGYGTYTLDFSLNPSERGNINIITLSTDKGHYGLNENVLITANIANVGNTEAQIFVMADVQDAVGNVIALIQPETPEVTIAPLANIQTAMTWNTGQFPPEDYRINLRVTKPGTGQYGSQQGTLFAERAEVMTIIPTGALSGSIAVNPPVTQVNMQMPVAITAAIRNTGNIPVNGSIILKTIFNGNIIYQMEHTISGLDVNKVQELNFGSFVPKDGGNYLITLKPTDSSITSNIEANLHVGDYAKATFTVTPEKALIGNAHVTGKITLKGIASSCGTVRDPLVPLMKEAIQKGVYWEQTNALSWQNTNKCYGCHVQAQTLIGIELSRGKVLVNDDRSRQFLDYMKNCQMTNGVVKHRPSDTGEDQPVESTTIYAWSLIYYHDETAIKDSLKKALDYLITRQNASGYWISDGHPDKYYWWNDLGWTYPSTPFTAYNLMALVKGYQLTGHEGYKTAALKATTYLLNLNHTQSIFTATHIVIGLQSALSVIENPALTASVRNKVNTSISWIKSIQNTDGGWGQYAGNSSDPLPTAHVLYAMNLTGVQGTDQGLRSGTTYLLNKQNPDGTWSTKFVRKSTYPDEYFSATTWAIISLPITLETIAGVDANLTIIFPQNITLDYSSIIPTRNGSSCLWDFKGLTDDGKELLLDLTLNGLQLGEERKASSDAYLSFSDTYTGNTINIPIEIPSVTGVSPVAVHVETDKELYQAGELVNITTTVTNISPEMRNPTISVTIEDMDGNVVDNIANFQIDNLSPSYAAPFLYGWSKRIKITADHTKIDADLTDFPVRLHLSSSSGIGKADLTSIFSELAIDPNDDFSGENGNPPDTNRWNVLYYATLLNNQLKISSTSGYKYVQSKFQLKGDFDIQVDYGFDLYPGNQNGWEAIFKILDSSNSGRQLQISRRYNGTHDIAYNKLVSNTWSVIGKYDTTEQSGKFRLRREGNNFIAYFWNGSDWISLGSYTYAGWSAATLVEFAVTSSMNNPQNTILIDNFKVNSGEVTYNGNRKKIAITTSDGLTQCYAEIEKWDAINKEADLWVKVPTLSSTGDNVLYFYYDSDQPDNTQYVGDTASTPAKNVWDSNYKAVYHFAQDPSVSQIKDSTSNANYGTSQGNMTSSDLVEAKVGKGLDFDGSDDRIDVPDSNSLDFNEGLTVEVNVKILTNYSGSNMWKSILSKGADSGNWRLWQLEIYSYDQKIMCVSVRKSSSDSGVTAGSYFNWSTNTWYGLSLTYDKAAGQLKFFKDGLRFGSIVSHSESLVTSSRPLSLGSGWWAGSFVDYSNIVFDEVRLSKVARSDSWIKANHYSINDDLVTFGSPESVNDINPSATRVYNFTLNTGTTPSGNYLVRARISENGAFLAEETANFTILPDKTLNSKVTADRISYTANQPATITSTVTSRSANYIFDNLTANITITGVSGSIIFTDTKSIPILTPGQTTEFKTYWNTGINPPGVYPVTLTITDSSGNVISTSTANITISGEIKPSKLLRGTISVDKQVILQGDPLNISYSVTNAGNIDLPQVNLSILTVHVVNHAAYDTLTDHASLLMGQTYANTQQLATNNYSAKDYLVILRANIGGVEETLAGTYFRIEGAPSAPSLSSPPHGEDVETLTPALAVNNAADPNDDELTYEFELYSDSGLTTLITSSGLIPERTNITTWQLPAELVENKIYYWRARAYDGMLYGEWMSPASFRVNVMNDPPTAPTLSSPADSSEVDNLTPLLVVNNASDPDSVNLTYNFELALDESFTQIVSSQIGIFEGEGTTSWQVPMELNDNTWYYWRSQADDWLDVGPWMTTARFFVNTANDAPTAPSIISPSNNSEITTLNADITALNSTDPDSSNLTYIFELDTVNTFDSPSIKRSGNIPEGQGTTSWPVEGLSDNTYYYVRVKANDRLADSPWSEVVRFFVNTTNDAPTTPVLANPSDGSGVNTFTPALTIHNSTDIDGDILTYEFEIYDASNGSLVSSINNIAETPELTSWIVNVNLTEDKTYKWRARAYDGELYSEWMPYATFMVNTANDAPGAPMLHSPADGSSLDTLRPTLSIYNAEDPDSDTLTYDFELYSEGVLITTISGIPQNNSGITSISLTTDLSDNRTFTWRAKAYDGDRYGAWMDMATFSIHLPVTNITATINFDPNTLNKKSSGKWVTVYMELPAGYKVKDINISSLRLNGVIPAEPWPYSIGDNDKDGIPDLMVKFNRDDVINLLPNGDNITVMVTGTVGITTFEGFDVIRVIK